MAAAKDQEPELCQFSADPAMARARVLPGEPENELLDLGREPWAARPAVGRPQRRPADLTAQDLQLVTEDHQLAVLDVGAASAVDEQAEQRPKGELREGEEQGADTPKPAAQGARPE